jgi:hypothetical protein
MVGKPPLFDNETKVQYRSLLLRLWREEGCTAWRFQVQDIATGQQQQFASMESLFDFLQQQADAE